MSEFLESRFDFFEAEVGINLEMVVNKVYFVCHPDDFDACYKRISADVFECSEHKCVIYKKKRMDMPIPEDQKEFIDDMSLLIVPVTRKLLSDMDVAFPLFEIEHAIGCGVLVLPFLMEREAMELYNNSVFGKRQWVSPDFLESDALSYKEKLQKFCREHFLDDKTAEDIKREFSTRIFLSYRKKDRKYAKSLMKQIHDQDGLDDVAIWYDEYLPLAKDFEISIEKEMDNSDAIAFLVTDNLTEEGNYVKNVEYRLAKDREAEKKILPLEPNGDAEIRQRVKEDFEKVRVGFPDYVEISEISSNLDCDKKENTPEHKYLIGLAYLNGFDVEKDVERAVKLFTESANEKYIPAAEKLRDMYSNGEGVQIDYRLACEWSDITVRMYIASPEYGAENIETLYAIAIQGTAYTKLGESKTGSYGSYLYSFGAGASESFDKARQVISNAINAMTKIGKDRTTDFVAMLHSISSVYEAKREYDSAVRYSTEAWILMYQIIKAEVENSEVNTTSILPAIEFEYKEDGNYGEQITNLLKNLEAAYEAAETSKLKYDYSDEILYLSGFAELLYKKRDYTMSIACAESARKLSEITHNKHQLFCAIQTLANAYRGYANSAPVRRAYELSEALKYAIAAYDLYKELFCGEDDDFTGLCLLNHLAQVYWSNNKHVDAANTFERILKIISDSKDVTAEKIRLKEQTRSDLLLVLDVWKATKIKGTKQYKNIEERIARIRRKPF